MRKLDFISSSPQLSIFNEDVNKTNLGGFIYTIYLIILLLLAIIYFYDYFKNDIYDFNYNYIKYSYTNKEVTDEEYLINSNIYTDLEVMFSITKDDDVPVNPYNFIIVDFQKFEPIIYNKPYTINTKNFQIGIFYRCDGNNCTIRKEDRVEDRSYHLNLYYKGYSINHQDPKEPIKKMDDYILKKFDFNTNTHISYLYWQTIEYEEEKGIFFKYFDIVRGKENTYFGADFKSVETFSDDGFLRNRVHSINYDDAAQCFYYLEIHPEPFQHDKYTRKATSLLDILADITALASTALDLMALAYDFCYSSNFNNYKIIENILSKKMRINIKNEKIETEDEIKIELNNNNLIDEKILPEGDNESYEKNDTENNINEYEDKNKYKESINLPIMNLYDFCIHQFYFRCFGHSIKQNLINSCNDIVAKYLTIENILYNQIRLENLLKDYKWNNPNYEMNEKNDFLLELKEK